VIATTAAAPAYPTAAYSTQETHSARGLSNSFTPPIAVTSPQSVPMKRRPYPTAQAAPGYSTAPSRLMAGRSMELEQQVVTSVPQPYTFRTTTAPAASPASNVVVTRQSASAAPMLPGRTLAAQASQAQGQVSRTATDPSYPLRSSPMARRYP